MDGEKQLISFLLMDTAFKENIFDIVSPEMLTEEKPKVFYSILYEDNAKGLPVDIPTLLSKASFFMKNANEVLKEIISCNTDGYNPLRTAQAIAGDYNARRVNEIISKEQITASNYANAIDRIENEFENIKVPIADAISFADVLQERRNYYFQKHDFKYRTGFACLDDNLLIENGDLVVLAAGTSEGKSAFALQVAGNMVSRGLRVLFFNLEMKESQEVDRIVAKNTETDLWTLTRSETIDAGEKEVLNRKLDSLANDFKELYFVTGEMNVSKIRRTIKKVKPDFVIIDYLQQIDTESHYKGNRTAEVSELSRKIRVVALDMNIPILALSQLNRQKEDYKEPSKSQIKESGSIEQDASIVLLLWKNDEKNEQSRKIKIAKSRQGALYTFDFNFDGEYMTFTESEQFNRCIDADIPF